MNEPVNLILVGAGGVTATTVEGNSDSSMRGEVLARILSAFERKWLTLIAPRLEIESRLSKCRKP